MLKNIADDSGVIQTIQLFLYLIIAVVHIPIIFFIGKEAVLIVFDEITRKSYSKSKGTSSVANLPYVQHEAMDHDHDHHENHEYNETHEHHNHHETHHHQMKHGDEENHVNNSNHVAEHHEEEKSHFDENHQIHQAERSQNEIINQNLKTTDTSAPKTSNAKEYLNMKPLYYYLITIISFVAVALISIVVGDVSIFFGLIGANAA